MAQGVYHSIEISRLSVLLKSLCSCGLLHADTASCVGCEGNRRVDVSIKRHSTGEAAAAPLSVQGQRRDQSSTQVNVPALRSACVVFGKFTGLSAIERTTVIEAEMNNSLKKVLDDG